MAGYVTDVTYAGSILAKSLDFTISQGREPSRAELKILPQDLSMIPRMGNLIFTTRETCSIPLMFLDMASVKFSDTGHVISFSLMDRRWAWRYSNITLQANLPLANGAPGIVNRMNAQALCAQLAFQMGEELFDFSLVPTTEFPPVSWREANAASELEILLASFGLEMDLNLFTGVISAVRPGMGDLPILDPADIKYQSAGADWAEGPTVVRVVGEDYRFQCFIALQATNVDLSDGQRKPINSLSFAPPDGWPAHNPFDLLQDNSSELIRNAAKDVYREYSIWGFANNGDESSSSIPGWVSPQPGGPYDILPLDRHLLNQVVDSNGYLVNMKPYIRGIFYTSQGGLEPLDESNTAANELLDVDFTLDHNTGVVKFEKPVFRKENDLFYPAKLWLKVAFRLRHPTSNSKGYYFFNKPTGLPAGFGVETIHYDDLTPLYITSYTNDNPQSSSSTSNNLDSLDNIASLIADAKAAQYQDIASFAVRYRFVQPVSTNGIIRNVRYIVSEQGSSTTLYINNSASLAAMTGIQRKRAAGALDYHNTVQRKWLDNYNRRNEPI